MGSQTLCTQHVAPSDSSEQTTRKISPTMFLQTSALQGKIVSEGFRD